MSNDKSQAIYCMQCQCSSKRGHQPITIQRRMTTGYKSNRKQLGGNVT